MIEPIYFYTKTMPFWGLSNFAPHGFEVGGRYWSTVEHYFQAQKFDDPDMQERIRQARSPKEARSLGQSRSLPIRPNWDEIRDDVMLFALRMKFSQPVPRQLLLSTGERPLVEASPFDYYWAAGQDGTGRNRLGELLVILRGEVRGESNNLLERSRDT